MRLGRLARLGAGGVVALLVAGACGDGAVTESASDATLDPPVPHIPEEIADGCGEQAITNPADLDAGRVVARCGRSAPAAEPLPAPATLRVAVPATLGIEQAPLLLAEALGEFEAENLTIELLPLDTRAAMDALASGEVDLAVGAIDGPYFDALHRGSGARVVLGGALSTAPNAMSVAQTGLWVRDDALDDDDLADLQLQPVAVPGGNRSAASYPISRVLGETEISLNEVALSDMPSGEAVRELLDGDVAAAWLDGGTWYAVAGKEGFQLAATLPASESVDGTIASARLLGPDGELGEAYARAVIRTINTYLTGDYRRNDEAVAALAEALAIDPSVVRDLPPVLFDWETRDGTLSRIEDALITLGGVAYDMPLDAEVLVDRTLATAAVGDGEPGGLGPGGVGSAGTGSE
jgi:NitT/TauT family transport system substrate-binding protein